MANQNSRTRLDLDQCVVRACWALNTISTNHIEISPGERAASRRERNLYYVYGSEAS